MAFKILALFFAFVIAIAAIVHFAPDRRIIMSGQEIERMFVECGKIGEDWRDLRGQCMKRISEDFRTSIN